MEEFVETFNRTSNQTIDLFEKTLGVYQATSVPDAQRRVHDLIESSLSALRVNVHSALNTNAKIIAEQARRQRESARAGARHRRDAAVELRWARLCVHPLEPCSGSSKEAPFS